jgi:hypothetical protein
VAVFVGARCCRVIVAVLVGVSVGALVKVGAVGV